MNPSDETTEVQSTEEKLRKCLICEQDCPQFGPQWHDDCVKCSECGNGPVDRAIIERYIKDKGPMAHLGCHNQKMEREIMNKDVTIKQGHLDFLNNLRFRIVPNMDLNDETNIQTAEIHTRRWLHESSIEEQFVALKMMTAACAMIGTAIAKDRDRIQQERSRKERVVHLKVDAIRKAPSEKRDAERIKQDPQTKLMEKAIKAFMVIGYSRDEAIKHWKDSKEAKSEAAT